MSEEEITFDGLDLAARNERIKDTIFEDFKELASEYGFRNIKPYFAEDGSADFDATIDLAAFVRYLRDVIGDRRFISLIPYIKLEP